MTTESHPNASELHIFNRKVFWKRTLPPLSACQKKKKSCIHPIMGTSFYEFLY